MDLNNFPTDCGLFVITGHFDYESGHVIFTTTNRQSALDAIKNNIKRYDSLIVTGYDKTPDSNGDLVLLFDQVFFP